MIRRALLTVAAGILVIATVSSCDSLGVGPFGNNDADPSSQCIPLAGHAVASYGWRWGGRQPADGAQVGHTTGKYDRLNLVLVVKLAPGRRRGRAAGVNVRYTLGGRRYLIPFNTALSLSAGPCEQIPGLGYGNGR